MGERRAGSPGQKAIATLRHRPLALWIAGRFASGTAATLLRTVWAWQLFEVSRSELSLGILGIVQFVPALVTSPIAGAVADARDRRRIVMAAQIMPTTTACLLAWLSARGAVTSPALFVLVGLCAVTTAFEAPARAATLPGLVPREDFAAAVTVYTTFQSLAFVTGPAAGGLLLAHAGTPTAYVVAALLYAASIALVGRVEVARGGGERRGVTLAQIGEGLAFVRSRPAVLGAMSLDMMAVIFAGATALLPVYATEILGVGAEGYGLLAASLDIGALMTSVLLVALPPIRRLGRALLVTIALYGAATIAFGLSRTFAISVAAYIAVGMADQVSVVVRSTLIQLSTPDELRGRVSSISMIFIGASNQLGAAEAGFLAAATSATFAVVFGGAACLAIVAAAASWVPALRRFAIDERGKVIGAEGPEAPA
jgi:MFS family permease